MLTVMATLLIAQAGAIARVVVDPDRAQVTRRQKVNCAPQMEVEFASLPPAADLGSLRAGSAGAVVEGLEVQERPRAEAYAAQAAQLDEVIRALEAKEAARRDARERAFARDAAAVRYLELASASVQREMALPAPDTKAWAKAYDSTLAARMKAAQEEASAATALREIGRALAEAGEKRARLLQASQRSEKYARVLVSCPAASSAEVELTYLVSDAGWTPGYEARAEEPARGGGKGSVELSMIATVAQSTGEDWHDARLTLSTAIPRRDATLPELQALRVFAEQREAPKKVLVRRDEERLHAEAGGAVQGTVDADTAIAAQGLSVQLAVKQPADIPGDGTPTRLPVARVRLPASFVYRSVPSALPTVFRVADLINGAPFPLLAGNVDVFRRGGLVARYPLPRTAQGAALHLTLGAEDQLKIKRTVVEEIARDEGVFTKSKRFRYRYRFELQNFLPGAATVELDCGVPVSELDDVQVGLDAATSAGYVLGKDDGKLRWALPLEPGEERRVELAFHVDVPADYDTTGL